MHLGIVGGLDRSARRYERLAAEWGHSVECHTGHLAGTGPGTLESLVLRADVVLVVTDVNSHAAVWRARRLARVHGRKLVLLRRVGFSRLRALFEELRRGSCTEELVFRALA